MTDSAGVLAPAAGLARLAARASGLAGWRRIAVAAALGALSVAALPPVYFVPALVPAFVGLLWQLEGVASRRGAFALGWAFGLGHFAAGLYWVGIAFLVDAPAFGWMMPFAVAGLAGGLALFPALATLAAWLFPGGRAARVLVLAVAWTAAAWLRGHVLTGFPWNLLATAWTFSDTMIQSVALFGAWGLSFLTVLAAAAPATLADVESGRRRWRLPAVAFGLLAAVFAGGALRLAWAPAPGSDSVPEVRLRIVQPNIPQREKWRGDLRLEHLKRHLQMSRQPGFGEVTHVIWPETAVPYFLSRAEGLREALASVAPRGGALITGLPRLEAREGSETAIYNSLVALGPDGRTLAIYDKFHLVPFGEYVPLSDWLPLQKLTAGRRDFTAGPALRTLDVPGLPPFSPLICYEAIFPGQVVAPGGQPGWLLNLTNDGWFGRSSGPYQHLASARLRAVEEGLPLVRAANTGISVVVDPYGRVLHRRDLGERGVIDAPLPAAPPAAPPYARLGDGVLLLGLLLATAVAVRRRSR